MSAASNNKLAEKLARVKQRSGPTDVDLSSDAAPSTTSGPAAASDPIQPAAVRPMSAGAVYRRKPAVGESWDERVKRATFYVDRALLDDLDRTCRARGLNKSEFVREALNRHLADYR